MEPPEPPEQIVVRIPVLYVPSATLRKSLVSGLLGENAAYGRASDLQSAGDLSLAHARAEQFPHITGVDCCCNWPPQSLAALAGVSQTSPHSFSKEFPF
jgi:hypothetical protein